MKNYSLMDSALTIGDILTNPNFDVNCFVWITDSEDQETILWTGYGNDTCPEEVLDRPLTYITIRFDRLVLEAGRKEE